MLRQPLPLPEWAVPYFYHDKKSTLEQQPADRKLCSSRCRELVHECQPLAEPMWVLTTDRKEAVCKDVHPAMIDTSRLSCDFSHEKPILACANDVCRIGDRLKSDEWSMPIKLRDVRGFWEELPSKPGSGRYFIEYWAGHHELSNQVYKTGVPCLEPVEAYPDNNYRERHDLLRDDVKNYHLRLAKTGCIGWAHFGLPCITWGSLHLLNGGTRRIGRPLGDGSRKDEAVANSEVEWLCEMLLAVHRSGGAFTVENPGRSLLFKHPLIVDLMSRLKLFLVPVDQCMFGLGLYDQSGIAAEIWKKPTYILTNDSRFSGLESHCDGSHVHTPIQGSVKYQGKRVARSHLAGRYTSQFCSHLACLGRHLWSANGSKPGHGKERGRESTEESSGHQAFRSS